ncbi:MAG: slipin family protein [Euryarchaeota archaeon]|nr:slipin family protein [Euryarchaeota archaeon]
MQIEGLFILVILALILLASSFRIIREYQRAVIFRLGRLMGAAKGPGIFFRIPGVDKFVVVDLRTITFNVPPQDIITKDNITVKVDAVVFYRVLDANKAITQVERYHVATSQIAVTTLRSVLGQVEMDELLSHRDKLNAQVQKIVDEHTGPWGVKVSNVEIKDVVLPEGLQRAMAAQAEAERNRRARIVEAEGELQASAKLAEAAQVLHDTPGAMFVRYLKTVSEATQEKATTMIIPIPVEFLQALGMKKEK